MCEQSADIFLGGLAVGVGIGLVAGILMVLWALSRHMGVRHG